MKNRTLKMEAPDGYRLCNITATTYELDLAVLRQLMAEYSEVKWKIFCDSTMINDTEKDTVDISEFESLVIPVKMSLAPFTIDDNPVNLAFHPKLWILVYRNDKGNHFYRISVGSCNMTKHDNLEVEFCAEGYVSDKTDNENIDIINLFGELNARLDTKAVISEQMLSELKCVHFKPVSDIPVRNFEFLITGEFFPRWYNTLKDKLNVLLQDYDELLVISPTISESIIRRINDSLNNQEGVCTILTYSSEMDKLSDEFKRSLNPGIYFEFWEDYTCRLHAKAYFSRKDSFFKGYIGSRNATAVASFATLEAMTYFTIENNDCSICELADCFLLK